MTILREQLKTDLFKYKKANPRDTLRPKKKEI